MEVLNEKDIELIGHDENGVPDTSDSAPLVTDDSDALKLPKVEEKKQTPE